MKRFPNRTRFICFHTLMKQFFMALAMIVAAGAAYAASDPNKVSFTLEGCNLDHGGTINTTTLLCSDKAYTTGNMGKSWAELDLVPHRLTVKNGNGNQVYSFAVAGDYNSNAGDIYTGWDVITPLVLNSGKSSAGCKAADSGTQTITPSGSGVGGADRTIYRIITIDQPDGTTCVYDYWQRLSLGAHNFSGSSLQSNLWSQILESFGQKRIQLPVAEIAPQELFKNMSASQDTTYTWNLTKGATPPSIDFGDTCLDSAVFEKETTVTLNWTKNPGTPGAFSGQTNVLATNPAHRDLTIMVTDTIYDGDTPIPGQGAYKEIVIPAGSVLFAVFGPDGHMYTAPSNSTDLNDKAVATYADTLTNIPIPGSLEAVADATIVPGSSFNDEVTVVDTESLTGNGLLFEITGVSGSGAPGTFGADDGDPATKGPVVWTSDAQDDSGSVSFTKVIHLDMPRITSGTLSDSAELLNSANQVLASAALSVGISSTAKVTVRIDKTIPDILDTGESVIFTFDVYDEGNVLVATDSITINAGGTSGYVEIGNLNPDVEYTIVERKATGWLAQSNQTVEVELLLEGCDDSVAFSNAPEPAAARVVKTTVPAGGEAGWEFELRNADTDALLASGSTNASGVLDFNYDLGEGNYKVVEIPQDGYELASVGGAADDQAGDDVCTFSVNLPTDANKTFACAFTNEALGTILIAKQLNGEVADTATFDYSSAQLGAFGISATVGTAPDCTSGAEVQCVRFEDLIANQLYTVSEDPVPGGFEFVRFDCTVVDAGGDGVADSVFVPASDTTQTQVQIGLAAGETVRCTYVNFRPAAPGDITLEKETVEIVDGGLQRYIVNVPFGYSATSVKSGAGEGVGLPAAFNLETVDGFVSQTFTQVFAGTHTVTEAAPPPPEGFDFYSLQCGLGAYDGAPDPGTSVSGLTATIVINDAEHVVCRWRNVEVLGDMGCTPGFWKNNTILRWDPTGYDPDQALSTVFSFPPDNTGDQRAAVGALASDSMLDALNYGGGNKLVGAAQNLLRAAVAAVLNASHPEIQYSMPKSAIISAVNYELNYGSRNSILVLAKALDDANNGVDFDNGDSEQCPLRADEADL